MTQTTAVLLPSPHPRGRKRPVNPQALHQLRVIHGVVLTDCLYVQGPPCMPDEYTPLVEYTKLLADVKTALLKIVPAPERLVFGTQPHHPAICRCL